MFLPVKLVVKNGIRAVFGMKALSAVAAASIPVLLLVALIERLTFVFSSGLAKVICGERYMRPHDGIIGEHSCGFDADVYFPEIDKNIWKETKRELFKANEKNIYDYSFVTYIRK